MTPVRGIESRARTGRAGNEQYPRFAAAQEAVGPAAITSADRSRM
jgi:hypothetical protein